MLQRVAQVELSPANGAGPWAALLTTHDPVCKAGLARVVELVSESGKPFDVQVKVGAGDAFAPPLTLSVSRATRLCVLAKSLLVSVRNLSGSANKVRVSIEDGFLPTKNVFVVQAKGTGVASVDIPPYAERVRLECGDLAASLTLADESGTGLVTVNGTTQPEAGLWVGQASKAAVNVAVGLDYRLLFFLSL